MEKGSHEILNLMSAGVIYHGVVHSFNVQDY